MLRIGRMLVLLAPFAWASARGAEGSMNAVIEIEETVYTNINSQNGSFPLWTYGSTILARRGDDLFFSATETIPDAIPLNCVRWALMRREAGGWRVLRRDACDRTREPSPLVLANGELLLSVNPALDVTTHHGASRPRLLAFDLNDLAAPPRALDPPWSTNAAFTEHSYRGFAGDPDTGAVLLMNVEAFRGQHWVYRDGQGRWRNAGLVPFPRVDSYKGPIPIRFLYPGIALRDGAAHVLAKGGVEEFDKERAAYRLSKNDKVWGRYHLGYCWSPDIAREPLSPWQYAVDLSETAGEVWNCDLRVAPNRDCHILWWEKSLDTRLRPRYFSDVKLVTALRHGVMRGGAMVSRLTLVEHVEGTAGHVPQWGRFHAAADGRVFVLSCETAPGGRAVNRLREIRADNTACAPVDVPLRHPFTMLCMTAAACGGTRPSDTLEIVGRCSGLPATDIRYARVRLPPAGAPAPRP